VAGPIHQHSDVEGDHRVSLFRIGQVIDVLGHALTPHPNVRDASLRGLPRALPGQDLSALLLQPLALAVEGGQLVSN
jgi:hypothetical protein